MPKVIVTGQARDVAKWEAGLRSRGFLLKRCIITTIGIGNDGNEVHHERNQHGLSNRLILPRLALGRPPGPVSCQQRLGGILKYYHRSAA